MTKFRKLTPQETALIDCLLKDAFPGRDELREQIGHARVRPIEDHEDNYGSLEFEVGSGPKAPVSQRVPVEAVTEDADGVPIEVLLHVVDGLVDELEIYKADGTPIRRRPEAGQLTVRTRAAG
jgi:hypothetical protein